MKKILIICLVVIFIIPAIGASASRLRRINIRLNNIILERIKARRNTERNNTPPAVCPAIYDPVCGVNGKTYSNICVLSASGARFLHNGVCEDD